VITRAPTLVANEAPPPPGKAREFTPACAADQPLRLESAWGSEQPNPDVHEFRKTVSIDFFTVANIRFQVLHVFAMATVNK